MHLLAGVLLVELAGEFSFGMFFCPFVYSVIRGSSRVFRLNWQFGFAGNACRDGFREKMFKILKFSLAE